MKALDKLLGAPIEWMPTPRKPKLSERLIEFIDAPIDWDIVLRSVMMCSVMFSVLFLAVSMAVTWLTMISLLNLVSTGVQLSCAILILVAVFGWVWMFEPLTIAGMREKKAGNKSITMTDWKSNAIGLCIAVCIIWLIFWVGNIYGAYYPYPRNISVNAWTLNTTVMANITMPP